MDRANDQAANSLLKTLEEPPDHLVLIMTAENAYDLLPTIRSRAVPFHFAPLAHRGDARVRARARAGPARSGASRWPPAARASPISLDLEAYDKRRAAMLALLKVAAGVAPFGAWVPVSEAIGRSKSEKLELYLKVLYDLLRDLLLLHEGAGEIRNQDIRRELEALAAKVEFAWIRKAVAKVDEIAAPDPPQHSEDHRARCADRGATAPHDLAAMRASVSQNSGKRYRRRLRACGSPIRHRRAAPPRRTPWRCGDRRSESNSAAWNFWRPGITMPSGSFFRLHAHAAQVLDHRADAVRLLDAQLARRRAQ